MSLHVCDVQDTLKSSLACTLAVSLTISVRKTHGTYLCFIWSDEKIIHVNPGLLSEINKQKFPFFFPPFYTQSTYANVYLDTFIAGQ